MEDEDTALHTKTTESLIAPSNHSEGELHQKEEYQACKQVQVKRLYKLRVAKENVSMTVSIIQMSTLFFVCMFV